MNISIRFLVAGVSMGLIIGLAACDKAQSAKTTGTSTDQMTGMIDNKMEDISKNPAEQDNMISKAIYNRAINAKVKTAILGDTDLRVLRIRVETTEGVTTLSGSVDTQQNSDKAMELAGPVDGVRGVENLLVVKANIDGDL